jgi:glycosyltransferase involved in cell wall biosynthesis
MRITYVSDRLSARGGADAHLRQVIAWAVASGHDVACCVGRIEPGVEPLSGVGVHVVRGLAAATASGARLAGLQKCLDGADVVHVQNIMNPVALRRIAATGRAVATVQDHRVFCPGMGKTLPDGSRCAEPFERADCGRCLPDAAYRGRTVALTMKRRDALCGMRRVVLSRYMSDELEAAGLGSVEVIPPWVAVGEPRNDAGRCYVLGGRLVSHKGGLGAYEAWRSADTGLPLEVAGEGPLAVAMGEARHLGWLGSDALRLCLRGARALLFPTFWQEPFGILAVEALAQGTPVVVMDRGGTAAWSDRGCVRVGPDDVDGMAAAIRRLAVDPDLALRLGEEGRRMVAKRFGREQIAPRLGAVYRDVAAASR